MNLDMPSSCLYFWRRSAWHRQLSIRNWKASSMLEMCDSTMRMAQKNGSLMALSTKSMRSAL